MNILLLRKKITHLTIALLLCCLALPGVAQNYHELTVLRNTSISFSFDNYSSINLNAPYVQEQAQNGMVVFNPTSNNGQKGIGDTYPTLNTIEYTPDADFLGEDVFLIRYRKQIGSSSATWSTKTFHINVVPSSIIANNDYATLAGGSSITVDVLDNDFSNGTDLEIRSVPVTNNGTVQLIDDNTKIVFTPEAGFSGIADFNYVICDGQGACDGAVVNICVLGGSSDYEKLEIFTKEDTPQVVIAALDGFAVTAAPQNGSVTDTSGVWVYHPNANFDGVDNFTLSGSGFTQEVEITVLNAPTPNTFVKNDTYYLAIDGEGVFFPLENDIGSAAYSAVALNQSASNGSVSYDASTQSFYYVPNPGFTGVDEFQYRARPGGSPYFEYGIVRVVVSNQAPANVNYDIVTPIGTPMVISYNIPIQDYIYTDWENAVLDNGTLEYFEGQTTQTINGQEVAGFNMLVYTPNADAPTGFADAFEYQYCAGGDYSDCHLVKINVSIEDVSAATDDFCVGSTCVWTGDTNTDGVVDIRDLLPIGWCMGEVGVARQNADTNWYGQHAENWDAPFSNENFDIKHVDVDGDGIVEAMDTVGISSHYGLHHNPTAAVEGLLISDDALGWGDGNPLTIQAGDVVLVPFYYGQENNPVLDAYGFTFELPYEPSLFNDVNIHYDDESWMSYNSPILTMNQDAAEGVLHSGYTRTSGVAASGFGPIGQVEFIVVDDLDGFRPNSNKIQVSFNSMGEMNGAGQMTASNSSTLTFILDLGEDEATDELTFIDADQLKVYPNPTREQLNVHLNGLGNEVEQVIVYSLTGQEVYNSGAIQTKRIELNVSDFATGMYVLKAFTNGGVINKKFEVVD